MKAQLFISLSKAINQFIALLLIYSSKLQNFPITNIKKKEMI